MAIFTRVHVNTPEKPIISFAFLSFNAENTRANCSFKVNEVGWNFEVFAVIEKSWKTFKMPGKKKVPMQKQTISRKSFSRNTKCYCQKQKKSMWMTQMSFGRPNKLNWVAIKFNMYHCIGFSGLPFVRCGLRNQETSLCFLTFKILSLPYKLTSKKSSVKVSYEEDITNLFMS